ncbi:NUDIX hydrolase [Bacillus sp. RO1]|uniref:NUDIX hydrolase n=1 Tax=Bacillus sp. RO1 TaxID=2722703 RepID=UPI00197C1553|nr:NUDIX hydrolase [Bacillus sp. RO1]
MEYIKSLRQAVGNMPLIICAVGVIVTDSNNKILLIKRSDDGNWCIPGGVMDVGESIQETAKREVFEETNINIEEMKLFNVYSGGQQHHIYPNGDEVYFVNVVFFSSTFSGHFKADGIESAEIRFYNIDELPENISPTNKPFIEDFKKFISEI